MTKRNLRKISWLLLLPGFLACATMNDVIKAKEAGKGTSEVYPVNEKQAWDIAKAAFRWEGSDAIEEHRKEGYMLTSSGMNMVSYGTVMGAWIEKVDKTHSKVTAVTKRRIKTSLATTLTEKTFHKRFKQGVALVKQGKPLPEKAPNS